MANKYGRQIFFKREEIRELADLVECSLVGINDDIVLCQQHLEWAEKEADKAYWQEQLDENLVRKAQLESLENKLWYYASPDEKEATNE